MCGGGADETPHGLRVFEGRWADGYIGRYPVRPGYAYVIWKGRHVAEPTELSPEETAGFWSDVARVAQAVEEQYQPAKMNWLQPGQRRAAPPRPPRAPPARRRPGRAPARDGGVPRRQHARRRADAAGEAGGGAAGAPATLTMLELLAEGRTAEVFAYGEGRVLKLDRPDWNGLSEFEGTVLSRPGRRRAAGGAAARHRHRRRAQRPDPRPGRRALAPARCCSPRARRQVEQLAERFAALQLQCNEMTVGGPARAGAPPPARDRGQRARRRAARASCWRCWRELDDGARGVCHYDFHPVNVLVGPDGWVVIDWLTVAAGPPAADLARTLVLLGALVDRAGGQLPARRPPGRGRPPAGSTTTRSTPGSVSPPAARLAEGFEGEEAAWLPRVAGGSVRLFA